jgi:hypothetical protein
LVVKLQKKRNSEKPTCREEDNIKVDLKEIGCGGVDWIWVRIGARDELL